MKICIFGLGKSGTTALLFKVAGGLPNCVAFSGGKPGEHVGSYENAVYKYTYNERKGKTFDRFAEHFARERYDRYIWMARDPRDAAISAMLYRWHRGHKGREDQFRRHLDLVLRKEKDPYSVSFAEICRFAGRGSCPLTIEEIIEAETVRYARMAQFVASLGAGWFCFRYEDMIDGKFEALNSYLGFTVFADAEVPGAYKKVVRKKKYGDWRHWFTEDDVHRYRPVFTPYMRLMGYDTDDWKLAIPPRIDAEHSSVYMQGLPAQAPRHRILRFFEEVARPAYKRFGLGMLRRLAHS